MKRLLILFTFSFGLVFSQRIIEKEIPGNVYPVNISSLQNAVQLKKASVAGQTKVQFDNC